MMSAVLRPGIRRCRAARRPAPSAAPSAATGGRYASWLSGEILTWHTAITTHLRRRRRRRRGRPLLARGRDGDGDGRRPTKDGLVETVRVEPLLL